MTDGSITTTDESSVVAIGECMLELVPDGERWKLGHAGDSFNTALYLARLGAPTQYLTALGDDPFSQSMLAAWRSEGLGTDLVVIAPGRMPGLYAIETDDAGERRFHYWRSQAPVRDLFRLPGHIEVLEQAGTAGLLYLSGITLSLFDEAGRAALADLARRIRAAGGAVAFDPNYRPATWPSPAVARAAIAAFAPCVSIVLPTFEDEVALHGDADPSATHARWWAAGVDEIVIKLGAEGCMIGDGDIVPPAAPIVPIDTTGAGDAFNAGYLAARRRGLTQQEAARHGNHLAGLVIAHRGAIIARTAIADLLPRIA